MPAEWEKHAATWLTWPRADHAGLSGRHAQVVEAIARITRELVSGEEVRILVADAEMEARARDDLIRLGVPIENVSFTASATNGPCCRDYGPVFVAREFEGKHERALVDWAFNAYGEKYSPWEADDALPIQVSAQRGLPAFAADMVLECGAIDVNGKGSLLAAETCLMHKNRNPMLNRLQIQARLKEFLGATNILWLSETITGDETDGHVDLLARFAGPSTIAVAQEEDIDDANYPALQENMRRLRSMRDQDGRLFRIVKLPMPSMVERASERLPASYLSFYIANEVVLVPVFRRGQDSIVLERLREVFPDRRVVGIDAADLAWGLGSLHSMVVQEPA